MLQKNLNFKIIIIITISQLVILGCEENKKNEIKPSPVVSYENSTKNNILFEQIANDKSGLLFNNKIIHDLATKSNLFDFDFFYNGAGVGVADINNDGLIDVFFCGNQVPNKLFLNRGDLSFEDISVSAGINTDKNWSNGVTFADVNNDGWMDIYVSQGGPYNREKRKNILLINQKNQTFKEEANLYGLDDDSISTQTAFFDYDKDGDLDCIVMNESDFYGYDPLTFYKINQNKENLTKSASHFYENKNGKFTDITEKAGLLQASFGLGLCIADINNDTWLDIYIANDYYVPDAMYISNKDGTFTNAIKEATKQVSFYGMGVDIGDINNDNLEDIFVLDMASQDHVRSKTLMASMNVPKFNLLKKLGYQTQYMFNSLQLNMGNDTYHNVGQFSGLSKTDWSWAGLIFDVDFDQHEDIYVTNGYRRYALDNDIKMEIQQTKRNYQGNVPLKVKEAIYNRLPSEKISNILFKNKGDIGFENNTPSSGLNVLSYSNGAAYADLDNDGDLDLVVNNMDSDSFLFKNLTVEEKRGNFLKIIPKGNLSESFVKVLISYNKKQKIKESRRVRGYLSSVDNALYFGLGNAKKIDTVKVFWPSGKYEEIYNIDSNTTLTVVEKNANRTKPYKLEKEKTLFKKSKNIISFKHSENTFNDFKKEILLPYKQSSLGPFITKGDANGDGIDDIYIGGAHNQSGALYIKKNQSYVKMNSRAFKEDSVYEDMEALFVDIDSDGDNDLYVISGGSEFIENDSALKDRIYLNDGKGNFKRDVSSGINPFNYSGKTVTKIDYDNDGDQDIIVGNRIIPQNYPLHVPSLIFENNNGKFTEVTNKICPELENFGIVNKVISTDINNDGWQDFMVVGEWTHIGVFLNNKGTFKDISQKSDLKNEKGWWYTIVETDINKDGYKDYLIGNVGSNIKHKVSNDKTMRVYANDFDNNGSLDVVLSQEYNGIFVPSRGKECSTQQMPFISEKIPTFSEFANASLVDIYGEKIYDAYQREVNQFKSLLLINNTDGTFKKVVLPKLAQTMPILSGETIDINEDGYEDLIVVGNIYNTEVETPRLDNNYGLVLLSNKKDNYTVLGPNKTGLYIHGNAKSVALIKDKKISLLIGLNNGIVQTFELAN